MAFDMTAEKGAAYRLGWLALVFCVAVILTALAFEYIGGYEPCPLCLMQRYAYYLAIPMLFAAIALDSGHRNMIAAILFFAVALAFLANAGLGTYHAGAEWKFWPGPATCGTQQTLTQNAGNLLDSLQKTEVIRCDEAQWRMFGLSFAGWNVLASLLIMILALRAAFEASPATRRT